MILQISAIKTYIFVILILIGFNKERVLLSSFIGILKERACIVVMVNLISWDFGLLLSFSILKAIIVSSLAVNLYRRWKRQSIRYWTDFPWLMSVFFSIYALSKLFDVFLYYYMRDQPESGHIIDSTLQYAEFLGKSRILMSYFTLAPLVVLMLIIWFQHQSKIQMGCFLGWTIVSFIGILVAKTYSELLIANFVISILPLMISVVTYLVLHAKKKMGTINNLLLAIGWSLVLVTQIIRPIWSSMGTTIWGMSWIGEIVETIPFLLVWYGFQHPAKYHHNSRIKNTKKDNSTVKQQVESVSHASQPFQ